MLPLKADYVLAEQESEPAARRYDQCAHRRLRRQCLDGGRPTRSPGFERHESQPDLSQEIPL